MDPVKAFRVRPELLIAVSIAFGVILRTLQYGANRSLWLDEVLMVPAIVQPSFLGLLNPVNWNHLPPGFLLLQKLSISLFGLTEFGLRLVPLLAGLVSLFAFARLAGRAVSCTAAPIAIGLFAVSPFLIYYSSEVKPYSTDVLASVLLLLLVFDTMDRGATPRGAAVMGITAVIAAAFSLTSALVAGGALAAMILTAWRSGDTGALRPLLAVLAGWAIAFGAPYLLFVHDTATNEYAREFWRSGFMPVPPTSIEEVLWLPRALFQVFRDPLGVFSDQQSTGGIFGATAGMVAFALGCAWMARHRPAHLRVLIGPVLVTLVASALMLYPFGGSRVAAGRVLLFLVPVFVLIMAEGAAHVWHRFHGDGRIVPLALLALLFIPALSWGAAAVPVPRTEIKPLLEYLEQEVRPGDIVYVHYDVGHAFRYYAPDYELAGLTQHPGVCARGEPARYLDALTRLRGAPRVWVLFGNGLGAGLFDERAIMLDFMEHVGKRLDDQVAFGASIYLYDLRPEMAENIPYTAELPVVPLGIADGCALWD